MTWPKRLAIAALCVSAAGAVLIAGLVANASMTWRHKLDARDTPFPELAAAADPEAIARGAYLVRGPAHCAQCHSGTDRDHPEQVATEPLHGGLAFEMGPIGALYARNITSDAKTGIGRRSDAELARVLKTGVLPEGEVSIFMRYSAAELSDDDIRDVIAYLRSTEPIEREVPDARIELFGQVLIAYAFPQMAPRSEVVVGVPASPEPTVARGEYLAEHVMLCTGCHTEFDPATFEPVGPVGGGGTVEGSHGDDSDMEYAPPNLTSHATGITGKLDEDQFVARIGAGRTYASSIMPWESFQATSEADLRSVYRYLRTLPPVDHDTGPSYRKAGWAPEG